MNYTFLSCKTRDTSWWRVWGKRTKRDFKKGLSGFRRLWLLYAGGHETYIPAERVEEVGGG